MAARNRLIRRFYITCGQIIGLAGTIIALRGAALLLVRTIEGYRSGGRWALEELALSG
jgi:hypothetical protein